MKRFWKDVNSHYKYAIFSAKSELKSEVADSYLSWIWWILEPFCFMLIYAFIFGTVFDAREPHFGLFIFVGLTVWDFFNRCLTQSVKLLKGNKAIISKVYIPKFILLISKMFFNGYKMLIAFGIIVIMLIYNKVVVDWHVVYAIPCMLTLFVLTFGLMTHLMHYGVYLQDLANTVSIVLRMIYYLTGIFFDIEKRLPAQYASLVVKINPMALILSGIRKALLYQQPANLKWLAGWFIVGVILAVTGVRKIYKNENSYVKVI